MDPIPSKEPPSLAADMADLAALVRSCGPEFKPAADRLEALLGRLDEGSFHLAVLGQFKRGKSTLVNALVGEPILPIGLVPVTSVVTVLTFGEARQATVQFTDGTREAIPVDDLRLFVDERANPENQKGAAAVDVRLPAPILRNGLSLVDTPGLGSTIASNTRAAQAFLPHIDVALAVVGADPPITAAELDTIEAMARDARRVVAVLNKADLATPVALDEVVAFTQRAIGERLPNLEVPLFIVSAREQLEGRGAAFDWPRLDACLRHLAERGRDALVAGSARRAVARFCRLLRAEIRGRDAALRAPVEATRARRDRLRFLAANIEASLHELRFRLDAAEAELRRGLEDRRTAFTADVQPRLRDALAQWLDRRAEAPTRLRRLAMAQAGELAERAVTAWLAGLEPVVNALYGEASERFVAIANGFLSGLAGETGDAGPAELPEEGGLRERRQFYFAHLMHAASTRPGPWVADRLGPRAGRRRAIAEAAGRYMDRLVASNASRVEHDFASRALESRRALEAAIRRRLGEAEAAAQRAVEIAAAAHERGAAAVAAEIAALQRLAAELDEICRAG